MKELDHRLRALHTGIVNRLLNKHRAHRDGAIVERLGRGHYVRSHIPVVAGKSAAHPAKTCDYLIEYQQDAVFLSDLPKALEIALGRQYYPGRT